jgi:hypothetical protein
MLCSRESPCSCMLPVGWESLMADSFVRRSEAR